MATYCTPRDVRLALTPRADGDNKETAASLPDWQIVDAIEEAEGIVNTYLLTRYEIIPAEVIEPNPEDPNETWTSVVAPSPIRGWTRSIAAYLATLTFRRNKDLAEDDPVRLRYLAVMDLLKMVNARNMDLALPPNPNVAAQGIAVVNFYEGRLFGLEDTGLGYDNRHMQRFEPLRGDRG